jgi:hypothetical protein
LKKAQAVVQKTSRKNVQAQAVLQKTSKKNVTSTVLIFFYLSVFLMDVMGVKITINLKELH